MNKSTKAVALSLSLAGVVAGFGVVVSGASCAATQHPAERATLGTPKTTADLLAVIDVPGTVTVETVASADWQVDRAGLINLEHEKAKSLPRGDEPIVIAFHALRHPRKGLFVVDTGVERKLASDPSQAAVRGVVAAAMKVETVKVRKALGTFLAEQSAPLQGVFLTHLHLDHVMGLPDVPQTTPIYAGPGETAESSLMNLIVAPNIDRALAGHGAVREWPYEKSEGEIKGVVDVFGDGMVWALWLPGHTPGTTAYVVRTPTGPVLLTGDVCHTRWGWENDVEPGTFNGDPEEAAAAFHTLRTFALAHPGIDVRLGHQ